MLDATYEDNKEHKRILDIDHPYSADRGNFGLELCEDLVYDEVIKTDKATIQVGEVIPNTPTAQYNQIRLQTDLYMETKL